MRFSGHHTIGRTPLVEVIELPPEHASVVRRDAGASGVQIAAEPSVAALSRLHRRGARARAMADREARSGDAAGGLLDPSLITAVVLTRDEERTTCRARLRTSAARHRPSSFSTPNRRSTPSSSPRSGRAGRAARRGPISSTRGASRSRSVTTPWAFMLDADEALDDASARRDLFAAAGKTSTLTRTANDVFLRAADAHAGAASALVRALSHRPCERSRRIPRAADGAAIHERWACDGRGRRAARDARALFVSGRCELPAQVRRATRRSKRAALAGSPLRVRVAALRAAARSSFSVAALRYGACSTAGAAGTSRTGPRLYPVVVHVEAPYAAADARSRSTRDRPRTCRRE